MEQTPEGATESEVEKSARLKRAKVWKWSMIVSGFLTFGLPLLGLVKTAYGMIAAFDKMGNEAGADPSELAKEISEATKVTAIGSVIAMLFFLVFVISVIQFVRISLPSNSIARRN